MVKLCENLQNSFKSSDDRFKEFKLEYNNKMDGFKTDVEAVNNKVSTLQEQIMDQRLFPQIKEIVTSLESNCVIFSR